MFLKQLNLTNFRNYSKFELSFDKRPTIFTGNNAAGKSNLLEAVYLLSITKSLLIDTEDELIKKGEEVTLITGIAEDDQKNRIKLEISFQKAEGNLSKRMKVNGIAKRSMDFIGNLPAVIFYPSDINMVTGSPSLRRWHLDMGLAQVDPSYKKALTLYEQFLTSRNRVLKKIREGQGEMSELDYWTEGLLGKGEVIRDKRQEFFEFINNLEKPLGQFIFEYKESLISFKRLDETIDREIAAAATLIGPHRDDFVVQIRNLKLEIRNLSQYGSRGEQRTATLAFKLAQLEYMAKILGKRPVLLLDDVFSELDANHRAYVVEIIKKQQTVVSTVELENISQEFLDSARILRVDEGKIVDF